MKNQANQTEARESFLDVLIKAYEMGVKVEHLILLIHVQQWESEDLPMVEYQRRVFPGFTNVTVTVWLNHLEALHLIVNKLDPLKRSVKIPTITSKGKNLLSQ